MAMRKLKLSAFTEWARFDARLGGTRRVPDLGQLARGAIAVCAQFLLLAALPFFVLVRVSVFCYTQYRYPTWLALAVGVACMLAIVTAYAAWLWRRIAGRSGRGGRARVLVVARRVALPLVLAYVVYALVYLSSVNAKSDQVRAYYGSLHPLLRVALCTWILVDREIVITDLARRPEDYATMGLPVFDGTLHYRQRDGYVHAADVRTAGRCVVKNWLVRLYFWSMGFDTLRHVGTADHLHVELPLP
jgi:hypothetical protein